MSIVNNLWEESSEQANCDLCPSDDPFYMPLERTDMMSLRLQIPYQYVTANGGGVPINASVTLSIVDEEGTTTLCNLGAASAGGFILGAYNDATNKVAEYQVFAPLPLADVGGNSYTQYYFDVNVGDYVVIIGGGDYNTASFVFGVDPLPANFYLVSPTRVVVAGLPLAINVTNTITINGVLGAFTALYSAYTSCLHENFDCFRYKFVAVFATAGITWTMYTKPFKVLRCDDSVRIATTYPSGTTDLNGYVHQSSFNFSNVEPNLLFLRLPADVEREANRVRKSYNAKCYNFRSEIQKRYRLKSDPVPWWFAAETENIAAGRDFNIDNVPYLMEDSDAIFENSDIESSNYQNINISLQQCKSEKVFVC